MFRKFAQKPHLISQILHNSQQSVKPFQTQLLSFESSHGNLVPLPTFSKFWNVIRRPVSFYSDMACESETRDKPNDVKCESETRDMPNDVKCESETVDVPMDDIRPYQVVAAATRDMGIGKDGKLPWHLPSDLQFFKELTTYTLAEDKRNAVVMGRKTWEAIPEKYRPLPSRLNVVLTRSGKLDAESFEDLIICDDLTAALKLLARPPYSESIEKVFVIGGGQILKEALNAPCCKAIHLTDIDAKIKCDTFMPKIDLSLFKQIFSSSQMEENDIQFSLVTYARNDKSQMKGSIWDIDGRFKDVPVEDADCKIERYEFKDEMERREYTTVFEPQLRV